MLTFMLHRLQGTDSALRDARVESIALKQKVEDQQRKILTLEADAAQKRDSSEEVVTLLRLQELDLQNKALQQSIAGLQTENVSLSEQLQQMKARRSPVVRTVQESYICGYYCLGSRTHCGRSGLG